MSKLYTEEQVKQLLFDLGDVLFNNCQNGIEEEEPEKYYQELLKDVTPIELPTDEEMEERAERNISPFSFIDGAKWMKDKIKGGGQ